MFSEVVALSSQYVVSTLQELECTIWTNLASYPDVFETKTRTRAEPSDKQKVDKRETREVHSGAKQKEM